MYMTDDTYFSKVYGCWMGKNVGGTLGAPLETGWGRKELFDVWWYPRLQEGGIPNDDLEIQLIWLQMLEDRGLDVKARDFADYWLDCIQYNPDEYGLHKTNLRKGLLPPLSGWHNNWFKHCMGSPIRSEIWACIAPGQPNIAAAYAYEDAILDHAGGESVFGEIFNAALESAAFVESDRDTLLNIGLSFIPNDCRTAKAIRNAMDAHARGLDWKVARDYVLDRDWHYNAQYSPVNLGFQTIGWLYGEDFGDALCKAVNCGYDTDCTGATLGAILGILAGKEGLPEKWTAPLSDTIATSMENGGLTNVHVPENLDALTRQTVAMGRKLLALHEATEPRLQPTDETRALWTKSPTAVPWNLRAVDVSVDLPNGPAIGPGQSVEVSVSVRNNRLTTQRVSVTTDAPQGFAVTQPEGPMMVAADETTCWTFRVQAETPAIQPTNILPLRVELENEPKLERVPIVLLGANRWLVSGPFGGGLDTPNALEDDLNPQGREGWTAVSFPDNAVDAEPFFAGESGVLYLRHYVYSPVEQAVRAGFPSNVPFRMWLNGEMVREAREEYLCRPNLWGEDRSYADVTLPRGWSQFFIKVERQGKPVEAHFTLADQGPWFHGLVNVTECRFPWETAQP